MKQEIKVPEVGESITEATIAEWAKASGDYVEQDEQLLSLETDKATVDIVAEHSGSLTVQKEAGQTVQIGEIIGSIDTTALPKKKDEEITEVSKKPEIEGSKIEIKTHPELKKHLSPALRHLVAEKQIDPSKIEGTGKGGRLTKADAKKEMSRRQTDRTEQSEKKKEETAQITRVKMTTIRKRIAQRLVESQQTTATLTTFNEIDMSNVMRLRKHYKEAFKEKFGVNLGFMGFFTKACIDALQAYPEVNATIEKDELVYWNYFNIGIAVGTEKGLVVPTVKNADELSLAEIESEIKKLALKARDGKLSIADLSNGTFTISNGGVYGSLMSTPILNPPQSGILGMHKIEERPIALEGEIKIRPMMYVALSYNHQVIDGKQSVGFLVRIKEYIEYVGKEVLGL